jgi:hypothetical protein
MGSQIESARHHACKHGFVIRVADRRKFINASIYGTQVPSNPSHPVVTKAHACLAGRKCDAAPEM